MKERLINYFFDEEELEQLSPYIKSTGIVLTISLIVSILFMIGV